MPDLQMLQEARVHQSKQREIDELTAEVLELDSHLREIITFLADGKDMLAEIIAQGDERLQAIELASKGDVSYSVALGYASILANFTSAPPTMDLQHPDKPFDVAFRPPFPTEEMMRKGKMNEEAPLGSLGETREVGRPLSPSAIPPRPSNADQYSQQSHALAQGVPTQYSTYNHHPPSGAKDDLFDLDLNPDF